MKLSRREPLPTRRGLPESLRLAGGDLQQVESRTVVALAWLVAPQLEISLKHTGYQSDHCNYSVTRFLYHVPPLEYHQPPVNPDLHRVTVNRLVRVCTLDAIVFYFVSVGPYIIILPSRARIEELSSIRLFTLPHQWPPSIQGDQLRGIPSYR
ncbi:uncharacterized protein EI90DRAFT_3082720 [Cantharellus anzutake]|uniref:uncharacterized protein n=1 Tax=Cantharellus anzutake TaxID=1750568 RepID=UPI0019042189|nr:uncharacterized protein EI90DRAFT_3082720 [Cantharellus anzutake]KAF8318926.1 hypothetical protein EI90DRAFT_3082720 [Cantharellus anzutake]